MVNVYLFHREINSIPYRNQVIFKLQGYLFQNWGFEGTCFKNILGLSHQGLGVIGQCKEQHSGMPRMRGTKKPLTVARIENKL